MKYVLRLKAFLFFYWQAFDSCVSAANTVFVYILIVTNSYTYYVAFTDL